jgi:predicted nucleic acid-binding protein
LHGEVEQLARPPAQQEPLRLTLSRNGQRKMVVLSPRNMNELAKVIKQKFRMKAHKVTDSKGKTVADDADLAQLAQDSVLNIA